MAGSAGFEPANDWIKTSCVRPLHHEPIKIILSMNYIYYIIVPIKMEPSVMLIHDFRKLSHFLHPVGDIRFNPRECARHKMVLREELESPSEL